MRKSVVIQCHRCQRFQHTARQCSFEYRCVQCTAKHIPGCCPRNINKKLPLRCCNCLAAGLKDVAHTANNLQACHYFKNSHSGLFNKFVNSRQVSEAKATSSRDSNRSAVDVSRPGISSDEFIGPARANNPNVSRKSRKTNSTVTNGWTTVENKKTRKANSNSSFKPSVKSGKSHTVSKSVNSSHRVEVLIGAFSKLLREFCNAS